MTDCIMGASQKFENLSFPAVAQAITLPVLSRARFAELIGVDEGVVLGWVNKGYLSTIRLGKYSLINLEALRQSCADKVLS